MAKLMLAMANSGGGCVVFGVTQDSAGACVSTGLAELKDPANIKKGCSKFLPTSLKWEMLDFFYEESEYPKLIGKRFQVLLVEDLPRYLPFVSLAESGKDIRKNAIYIRSGTNTVEADHDGLQAILNRRIETEYSTRREMNLETELGELKKLYSVINSGEYVSNEECFDEDDDFLIEEYHFRQNPFYPKESHDAFVARLIEGKKWRIEHLLGLEPGANQRS